MAGRWSTHDSDDAIVLGAVVIALGAMATFGAHAVSIIDDSIYFLIAIGLVLAVIIYLLVIHHMTLRRRRRVTREKKTRR
ncbi:MAG TPA: hypothetical protein VGH44_05095 [Candidatus Saccharimonadia bacterium]